MRAMWRSLLIFACLFALSCAFQYNGLRRVANLQKVRSIRLPVAAAAQSDVAIPAEVAKLGAINEFVLVERLSAPTVTAGGLFIPKVEGRDLKPLGRVLSIPPPTSMVIEHGSGKASKVDINFKVGDVVAIRDPWGVGPKDIELEGRCFSFHKAAHIIAKVQS